MMTPETVTERTAKVILHLAKGGKVTLPWVMQHANLKRSGAYALMSRISRSVELRFYREEWSLLKRDENDLAQKSTPCGQ